MVMVCDMGFVLLFRIRKFVVTFKYNYSVIELYSHVL